MATETTAAPPTHGLEGAPAEVAGRLGPGARCLFLVGASRGADAAAPARELARRLGGRRRRVLLLDLADDGGELERLMGGEDAPGLTAAFRGEAGVVDVAVRDESGSFFYFPRGAAAPDALLSSRSLSRLLRHARGEDSTLLLYVGADPLRLEALEAEVDGSILLGDAPRRAAPASVPLLARVRRPREAADKEERRPAAGRAAERVRGPAPSPPGGSPPRAARAPADAGPGLVGFSARRGALEDLRSRWAQIVLVCGIALALGFLIAWEGAHDLLLRWMEWSAEVRGQAW